MQTGRWNIANKDAVAQPLAQSRTIYEKHDIIICLPLSLSFRLVFGGLNTLSLLGWGNPVRRAPLDR